MGTCETVYLRCGDLPEGGRSRNFRTNELEAGVSVYEGFLRDGKAFVILPTAKEDVCCTMSDSISRPVYLVKGDVVGVGGDGEPVLANAHIVKRVELFGAEGTVDRDRYAGKKPVSEHRLATNYTIVGSEEHTITCSCGVKVSGPDYYDVEAAFDSHLKRYAKHP